MSESKFPGQEDLQSYQLSAANSGKRLSELPLRETLHSQACLGDRDPNQALGRADTHGTLVSGSLPLLLLLPSPQGQMFPMF